MSEKHYASFIDKYTTEPGLGMDGITCYRLRCGIVHRGNAVGHPKFDSTHVIFTLPNKNSILHAFSIVAGEKKAAMFDLAKFCGAIETAARSWYVDNGYKPLVVDNLKNLICYRHFGVSPFVTGVPVLATGP